MTAAMQTAQEIRVQVAGGEVVLLKGGSGDPLVIVHHDIGTHGWLRFEQALAERFTVHLPDMPGYGKSKRPEWARNVRDIVAELSLLFDTLGLRDVALVGLGYGGWLAAEMATMGQTRYRSLALVNPMGILPREGEILDQFLVSQEDYIKTGFHDLGRFADLFTEEASTDQLVAWDICREMTTRVGWKPYMFNRALPFLLENVTLPTLVVHSRENRIVPISTAEQYVETMPNARLEVIDNVGHFAELEQPDRVAQLVIKHAAGK